MSNDDQFSKWRTVFTFVVFAVIIYVMLMAFTVPVSSIEDIRASQTHVEPKSDVWGVDEKTGVKINLSKPGEWTRWTERKK